MNGGNFPHKSSIRLLNSFQPVLYLTSYFTGKDVLPRPDQVELKGMMTKETDTTRGDPVRLVHALPVQGVLRSLASSPARDFLEIEEAEKRLQQYGINSLRTAAGKPLYLKLFANFTHLMAILLWIGGAMAFVGHMPQLGWAIWCVVIINALFSFFQEYRAERAVEALRQLLPARATVVRDGEERIIPAEELVPGDLMVIVEGDKISADGQFVEETELRMDRSTLSGESHPTRKTADASLQGGLSRAEYPNLVFAGTIAATGTGKAVIIATAMDTEFGKIAHLTSGLIDELLRCRRRSTG